MLLPCVGTLHTIPSENTFYFHVLTLCSTLFLVETHFIAICWHFALYSQWKHMLFPYVGSLQHTIPSGNTFYFQVLTLCSTLLPVETHVIAMCWLFAAHYSQWKYILLPCVGTLHTIPSGNTCYCHVLALCTLFLVKTHFISKCWLFAAHYSQWKYILLPCVGTLHTILSGNTCYCHMLALCTLFLVETHFIAICWHFALYSQWKHMLLPYVGTLQHTIPSGNTCYCHVLALCTLFLVETHVISKCWHFAHYSEWKHMLLPCVGTLHTIPSGNTCYFLDFKDMDGVPPEQRRVRQRGHSVFTLCGDRS